MNPALSEIIRFLNICLLKSGRTSTPSANAGAAEMYVCLTTTPKRIAKIGPTLASLADQSVPPTGIFLYLPDRSKGGQPYTVPDFVSQNPLITIKTVREDVGPATKWFYTGADRSIGEQTPIIVLDDDQVYPKRLLEHYLKCRKEFPTAAITLLGWRVPSTMAHADRKFVSASRVRLLGNDPVVRRPERVHCVQGASSFMISKSMIEYDQSYFDRHEATLFADDILISGLLAKKGVPVMVVPAPFRYIRMHTLWMMMGESLFKNVNKAAGYNDALYQLFKDFWR